MRSRWKIAACVIACMASAPAIAQQAGGAQTETAERDASPSNSDNVWWNLIGLLGLIGLRGLWRDSDNDGYTNDPV